MAFLGLLVLSSQAQQPSKEYIRLGGRVIAIESPPPLPAPNFALAPGAPSVSVAAGNPVGNQINLTVTNFSGTVTFSASVASPITAAFSPASLAAAGSTTLTLTVPANTAVGAYTVTVTGTSANPSSRQTQFTLNVTAPASTPQSAVFGPGQFLSGATPASFNSLTNWRFETRLHLSASTLASGTSLVTGLGSVRLLTYRYGTGTQLSYSLILGDGASIREFWLDLPDIYVRVQRTGSTFTLKAWKVESNGTLSVPAGVSEVSGDWSAAASISPGFSLGANTNEAVAAGNDRLPLNGRMAFFRFYDSVVANSTLPNPCDTSTALGRYEFENNLTNAGTAATSLVATGAITYQPTPADSCSSGGGTPSFQIISGAQSPAFVTPGASATYPVTINRQNFAGLVTFSGCSGAPAGVSCSAPATTATSAQVTVSTSSATPVATHSLTLNATGSGVPGASAGLSLLVAATSNNTLSITTPSVPPDVRPGSSTSTTFAIVSTGITAPVQVSCAAAVDASVTCPATTINVVPGTNNVTLTVNVGSGATGGVYSLTLNAVATSLNIAAPSVSTSLTINRCSLGNLNNTTLPMNEGAPITLGISCTPPASTNDTITWQLLNGAGQVLNSGTATGSPNSRVFNAPPNSTSNIISFTARATYNLSPSRTADFTIQVNPIQGLTIYPQGTPPYSLNPGGSLSFGIIATGPVTCSVPQGSLVNSPPPGYTYGYLYTAPTVVGQLNLTLSCTLNSNTAVRGSFPIQVNDALSIPPTVTSLIWYGNGNTTSFQSVVVQGTHVLAGALPQSVSLRIGATVDGFNPANACWSEAHSISYGQTTGASWRLWDNSGTSISYDQGVLNYYLHPAFYSIYYRQNSQCQANYVTGTNSYNYNYGPASLFYNPGTQSITATHGIRYLPAFVGTHPVWGQVTLYTGLQSAWTPPLSPPTTMVVQ